MLAHHRRRARRTRARSYLPTLELLENRLVPSLLGLAQTGTKPDITSGIINDLSYTQVGNNANPFHYDSIPLWITMPDGSVDYLNDSSNDGPATTSLDVTLDNAGQIAAGNAGNNPFSVIGQVTLGTQTYDGTLLTAQATAFGFGNSFSPDAGDFEVSLAITGGLLAAQVSGQPAPFRIGDTLGLLLHQPALSITSFPNTFSFSSLDSGLFEGMSDALNIPAQSSNQNNMPQVNMGCGQLTVDPTQGLMIPFGNAQIAPQNGNVQIQLPLDFNQSVPTCSCGCVGEMGNVPQGQTNGNTEVQTDDSTMSRAAPAVVYNSDTVDARPIIQGTFYTDTYGMVPTQLQAELTWNGTPQPVQTYDTTGHNPGDTYALAVQVGTPVTTTGLYPWQMQITATFPDGSVTTQQCSGSAEVVANDSSPYGPGWSLAGVDQLVTVSGGVLWVYGSGGRQFFAQGPGNTFVSPSNNFGSLVQNNDGSFTSTAKDQTQSTFDSNGRLVTVTDPHGLAESYTYDGTGRLTGVTEPDGGVTNFTYSGSGLQSIDEPGGRVLMFAYDGAGNLQTATDPEEDQHTFTYDSNHHLTGDQWGTENTTYTYDVAGGVSSVDRGQNDTMQISPADVQALQTSPAASLSQVEATETDGLGRVTTYTLDSQGRVVHEDQPLGVSQSWQRDDAGQVTVYTDPLDRPTYYSYQYGAGLGDQVETIYPDGSTQRYQYDPTYHEMTQLQDQLGNVTAYTYNPATGDLLTVTDPLGGVTTYTWSNGLLQSQTDANNHTTTYQYDSDRRLTVMTDALGHHTMSTYDAAGNQATIQDPLGNVTTSVYDGDRRLVMQTDAAGGVTTMTYNAQDQMTSETDPLGYVTQDTYDSLGRLTQTTEAMNTPVQRITTDMYDAVGNLISTTDPRGIVTHYTYDALNRQTSETDAFGTSQASTSSTTYDADGNVVSTTDPLGNTTTYTFDVLNRQVTVTDPLGETTTTAYDADGNVVSVTDPRGFTTTNTYDALNRRVQTMDALGDITTIMYDSVGDVIQTTDPRGNTTTDAYDALNRLTAVTDPLGHMTTTAYDTDGNIVRTTDPLGNTTTYTFDALNRQITVTDALGETSITAYDADGNVVSVTDPRGIVTHYAYDALNRQTSETDAFGTSQPRTSSTTYDADGNVVSTTDPLGNTTTYTFDALNRRLTVIDALGETTTTAYDADGNVVSTTDPLGNATTYTFDALNRRITVTDPLGDTTRIVYDADGDVISVTDPRGFTTSYTYDALDRRVQTMDALGDTTITVYDAVGNVIQTTDPRNFTTTDTYDALNRLTAVTDPLGHTTTTAYDADGNVVSTTDPLGNTTTYTFDALNRLVSVHDPAGGTTTTTYDPDNNVLTTTDQLGNTTTNTYDAFNRLITTIDPRGGTTSYTYDADDNRLTVTDPVGNTTTFFYDALNRQVQQLDPLGNTTTDSYDADSRLLSTTDRDGRTIQYHYDAAGRMTGQIWEGASNTVVNTLTYTYDADGNLLTATDAYSAYTITYDALDRPISVDEPFGVSLMYTYDADGNRTAVQDSLGGTTSSSYDANDLLSSRQFTDGTTQLRIDLTYNASNELAGATRFSDMAGTQQVGSSVYTYDGNGRVTSIQHQDGGGNTPASYAYTYDLANRLTMATINGTPLTYGYDATNELTNDNGTSYSYDLNGNPTGDTIGTGNQLLYDGTWHYTYDAEGNLITKTGSSESWTYTYDNRNQLLSAQHFDSGHNLTEVIAYTYDVFGNRIEEDVTQVGPNATTVTRFAYDGENAWADLDGSNHLQTRRLYLDAVDQVFARIETSGANAGTAWYLTDSQGTIRDITDATGALRDHLTYDGFGNVLTETNSAFGDRYKFAGREFDSATGLYFNRARYYDPLAHRFTSEDPRGFAAGDTNLYRYVHNTPTNATDPQGLDAMANGAAAPGARWVTKNFGADGVGATLISMSIGGTFFVPPFVWGLGGAFQYLYDCRNGEEGLFTQVAGSLGIGTPGLSFNVNFGVFWVWGLQTGVSDYAGLNVGVNGTALAGIGGYFEAFVSPGSVLANRRDPTKEIVRGFGFGISYGLPSASLTAQFSWSWLLALRKNPRLRPVFCCQLPAGAPPLNKKDVGALAKQIGQAPVKALEAAARAFAKAIDLPKLILPETLKQAKRTGGTRSLKVVQEALSDYPNGVPLEWKSIDVSREK